MRRRNKHMPAMGAHGIWAASRKVCQADTSRRHIDGAQIHER